jgi:hypothetical protein
MATTWDQWQQTFTSPGGAGYTGPATSTPAAAPTVPYGVNPQQYMAAMGRAGTVPAAIANNPSLAQAWLDQQARMGPGVTSVGAQLGIKPYSGTDGQTAQNYTSWLAAGQPNAANTMSNGQAMAPGAWDATMAGIAGQGGPAGIAAWQASQQPGSVGTTATGYGNNGGATGSPASGGTPSPVGVPASSTPSLSVPGTQPNFPLDIGSYLNPMLGYGLQQGYNTIANGNAAMGNLLSGDTLKQLMGYGLGQGLNAFNNAANIGAGQQNFGYNVANNDRNFAYNAANNDRNFNQSTLMDLANLGLAGAGGQAQMGSQYGAIMAQLMQGLGQAQGTGTMGSNNAIVNAILQSLGNTQSTNLMNRILPSG